MKNARDVNYLQVDAKVKKLREEDSVIVMESRKAWEKYKWTRKYFKERPKQGYFILVKESVKEPIVTCVLLSSSEVEQSLNNLLVLEENVHAKVLVSCAAVKKNLRSVHLAFGNVLLRKRATLVYEHVHNWMGSEEASMSYKFYLESGARLNYSYKAISPAREMKLKASTFLKENAASEIKLAALARKCKLNVEEFSHLLGKGSSSTITLRLVAGEGGRISSRSKIAADAEAKGHVDCQGLIVGRKASITLAPELQNNCKNAMLTHEASIGRIAEEQLDYLRSRGLNESKAISLIVRGFLKW